MSCVFLSGYLAPVPYFLCYHQPTLQDDLFLPYVPLLKKKKKAYLAHSLSFSGFPRQFLKIPVIEAMCDRTLYNL